MSQVEHIIDEFKTHSHHYAVIYDHIRPDSLVCLLDRIKAQRLECATLHILTPYPGTPLFRQMEREGRLLHKDWDLYDTAHAVFQPKHMSPSELEEGYAWMYRE